LRGARRGVSPPGAPVRRGAPFAGGGDGGMSGAGHEARRDFVRADGRAAGELRPVTVERGYIEHCPGSVLISLGRTRVLCTATIEDRVPQWMRGEGQGWLTAEYGMIPGATQTRQPREVSRGKPGGRTQEIQRLIGRSLRAVVDL